MSRTLVWDCIMYAGEADMLEMRLHELDSQVHRHVIVEATVTHRGLAKPLHYPADRNRFARWAEKITYVLADDPPASMDNWQRERWQRDQAARGLAEASPWDVVLVADVDEIPSPRALTWHGTDIASLLMRTFHSAVDWEYPRPQLTSVLGRWGSMYGHSLAALRAGRHQYARVWDGGWHFTWVGSQEYRQAKLAAGTCHVEMPAAEWEAIGTGASYARGVHYAQDALVHPVDVDGTWPGWIRDRRCPADWFRPRE